MKLASLLLFVFSLCLFAQEREVQKSERSLSVFGYSQLKAHFLADELFQTEYKDYDKYDYCLAVYDTAVLNWRMNKDVGGKLAEVEYGMTEKDLDEEVYMKEAQLHFKFLYLTYHEKIDPCGSELTRADWEEKKMNLLEPISKNDLKLAEQKFKELYEQRGS